MLGNTRPCVQCTRRCSQAGTNVTGRGRVPMASALVSSAGMGTAAAGKAGAAQPAGAGQASPAHDGGGSAAGSVAQGGAHPPCADIEDAGHLPSCMPKSDPVAAGKIHCVNSAVAHLPPRTALPRQDQPSLAPESDTAALGPAPAHHTPTGGIALNPAYVAACRPCAPPGPPSLPRGCTWHGAHAQGVSHLCASAVCSKSVCFACCV